MPATECMRRRLAHQGHAERKCPTTRNGRSRANFIRFVYATGAFDVTDPSGPTLFRSYKAAKNKSFNCCIWEAARDTSAASTFFERIAIGPEGALVEYVDAGLGYNNAVRQVIDEAERLFGKQAAVACVVSIGTRQTDNVKYAQPSTFQNILPTESVNILAQMATDSERTAEGVARRYKDVPGIYTRLDVARGLGSISHDEWERLGEVEHYTKRYMEHTQVDKQVDSIVNALRGLSDSTF